MKFDVTSHVTGLDKLFGTQFCLVCKIERSTKLVLNS